MATMTAAQRRDRTETKWSESELRELRSLEEQAALLPEDAPRVLLSIRLSILTEETTSPQRQELDLRRTALDRRLRVVGVASDLNVSATKVPPWKRPALGDWMVNRVPEFDIILFWKMDRFARHIMDLHHVIQWCKKYGKDLIAVKDPIDLSSPFGEMMATMIAGMARIEAANTGTRLESLWKHNRLEERWSIGKPTYGYQTVKTDDGLRLEFNEKEVKVIRWMASRILAGKSFYSIGKVLTRAKVRPPNVSKKHDGKWHTSTISRLLRNPALKGVKVQKSSKRSDSSVPVIGTDGQPVRVGPAILSDDEFEALQRVIDVRSLRGPTSRSKRSKFLGVIKCHDCKNNFIYTKKEKTLANQTVKLYEYGSCNRSNGHKCDGHVTNDPADLYRAVTAAVLDRLGDQPVVHRTYARGSGALKRTIELQQSIQHYMTGLEPGGTFADGGFMQRNATESLRNLSRELASIDPEETKDRWTYKPMGLTYRQRWNRSGQDGMEEDLLRGGITFEVFRDGEVHMFIPEELEEAMAIKEDDFGSPLK